MTLKRKSFLILVAFILVIAASFSYFPVNKSSAVLPFGGQITGTFYCNCSANLLISVGPPVPGVFIYQPGGTALYSYGRVWSPGAFALGLYSPGGVCLVYVLVGCAPIPNEGTMIEIGTSS